MNQLNRPRTAHRLFAALCLGAMLWGAIVFTRSTFAAEEPKAGAKPPTDPSAKEKADQALAAAATESATKFEKKSPAAAQPMPSIDWFEMIWKGGPLMIPIGIMSVIVVAFTIERAIGLRRKKVIPRRLVTGLGAMAASPAGFDPRKAYRLCQQYTSSASNVMRAMLLKVGRPTDEVERAVSESIARETWKLKYNVRP